MSHRPGLTLEDFLTDWFHCVDAHRAYGTTIRHWYGGQAVLTPIQFASLVRLMETVRQDVEHLLARYEEEEHGSWRDYKCMVIGPCIPEYLTQAGLIYLAHVNPPRTMGLTELLHGGG